MHGICHVEIGSTDVVKSRAFLEEIFGWTFTEMGPEYLLFSAGEGPGGGLERVETPRGAGDVQIYIEVASIDETLGKAGEHGGETAHPKTEIGGGHGFFAKVEEPGGAVLGLWQAAPA